MKTPLAFLLILLPLISFGQLNLLNDEFEDPTTLSQWQNINDTEGWGAEQLESHDIHTTLPGKLQMMPFTSSWYEDWRGTLLYKEVTGDFIITTQVTVTNRAGNGIPASAYSLGGLMIRTPRNFTNGQAGWTANGENYLFLALGRANMNTPQLEVKTTQAGSNPYSDLEIEGIASTTDVQIRWARSGRYFICLVRLPGQNWAVHRVYDRPDMPNILQVGFTTYTDWDKVFTYTPIFHNGHVLNANLNPDPSSDPNRAFNPDLIAGFDFARFNEVNVPANLMGADLTMASDMDLLSFLGFDSEPVSTSIANQKELLPLLEIYPNPATNILRMEVLENLKAERVEIYDLQGRKVQASLLSRNSLNVSNLKAGMYFLQIFDRESMVAKARFLKK